MNDKMTIEIYKTRDYSKFVRLVGNRIITDVRIHKIKESIKNMGYISNPLIVNEKMEVIDGQGRLEALKQLDMPVEYRIINGLSIEECRAMNLDTARWKTIDYVRSYAELGNKNYQELLKLYEKYNLPLGTLFALCNNTSKDGQKSQDTLRNGVFSISPKTLQNVENVCKYLTNFHDVQKKIGGKRNLFYGCIGWIALQPKVDLERLNVSIHQQYKTITPFARTEDSLKELSEVYNKGYAKNKRRYFDYEWKNKDVDFDE